MGTGAQTDRRELNVRVLTPDGAVFEGAAYMVIAPSVLGEVGILPRHAPFIAFLKIGETRVKMLDDSELALATADGYMSVEDNEVLVLVEQAEEVATIDRGHAEAALQAAKDALEAAGDDEVARTGAEAAMARAENRLRLAEKAGRGPGRPAATGG